MIAWSAIDLASGRRAGQNGDAALPSASTIKLVISVALWSEIERGRLSARDRVIACEAPAPGGGGLLESLDPDTAVTLADLDLLMLAVSDNAATNAILDLLGFEAVNREAQRLGLRATVLRRAMGDERARARGIENTTCADDLAGLLAELAAPARIDRRVAWRVLAALAQSHHTDIIPAGLPPAAMRVVASKQGGLDSVRHDAALIEEPDRRVAMAVLSAPPGATAGLARVAGRAYAAVVCEQAGVSTSVPGTEVLTRGRQRLATEPAAGRAVSSTGSSTGSSSAEPSCSTRSWRSRGRHGERRL